MVLSMRLWDKWRSMGQRRTRAMKKSAQVLDCIGLMVGRVGIEPTTREARAGYSVYLLEQQLSIHELCHDQPSYSPIRF
jgi:hypothetical protein